MFRAQSAHHQEVNDANCTYAASGIVTLCKWPSCAAAKEGLKNCARNMWRNLMLCNLCEWIRNLCIKLVIIKKLYYDARSTIYQETQQFLKFLLFCSSTIHVSDGLSVHHQASKTVHNSIRYISNRFCWLLASGNASKQSAESVWHIPDAVMYSLKLLMMDGKTVRNT